MKRKIMMIVLGIGVASVVGVSVAGFASAAPTSGNSQTNSSQSVKKHKIWMRRNLSIRINQAVRDGTITKSQAESFRTELKNLRAEYKATINKSSTKSERQAERAKLKAELNSWAASNNFPLAKILPKFELAQSKS